MIVRAPNARAAGWALAGVAAAALLGGAVMALAAERRAPVLILDLGALPPAAPAVAAVAESAPLMVDELPVTPDEPAPAEAAPQLPQAVVAPKLVAAAPVVLPVPEGPVTAGLALPPPPEKPEPKTEKVEETPVETPKPAPDKRKAADKPKTTTEKVVSAPAASAPKAGSQTKGGAVSPAAFARAVMQKVRSTKKTSGAGKGTVVVGFTIAADGGLAGVRLLQGSGNAALDKIALDHIRRSAPFPMPPKGAGRSYSFEFVGK